MTWPVPLVAVAGGVEGAGPHRVETKECPLVSFDWSQLGGHKAMLMGGGWSWRQKEKADMNRFAAIRAGRPLSPANQQSMPLRDGKHRGHCLPVVP